MDRGAWQATAHRVVKELDSTEVSLFSRAPKSLQMVTAAMKLKDTCSLKEKYDLPRQHIKKLRHLLYQQWSEWSKLWFFQ